jgi:hypothetical protein
MNLQSVTCLAMATDPVGLAVWLRSRLDAGEAPARILVHAAELDLHPLSVALCRTGLAHDRHDLRQRNREAAALLGVAEPWISQIQANGLRIRGAQIRELPAGLVMPRLDLSRLKHLVEIPRGTYAPWTRLHQCHSLVKVPLIRGLRRLELFDCHGVKELPGGLELETLHITACMTLETLPLLRAEQLIISSCPTFRRLPDGLWFRKLVLERLPNLEGPLPTSGLPEGAKAKAEACPGLDGRENP